MANLVDHVRTEHEAFACDHCARRFQNKENLEEHVEEHVVKCDVCEERFFSQEDMVGHRREEHELEDCDLCDQVVSNLKQPRLRTNVFIKLKIRITKLILNFKLARTKLMKTKTRGILFARLM